jgi:hypothetical protein
MSFGFIITRHVNSEQTNRYWNQNIKLLRLLYPNKKIIIIDDNSKAEFVKADFYYKNVEVIQSQYSGSGELLPYIYFLHNPQWFENAVIIHDSVFIHKRIAFEKIKDPVLPLWHFDYDKENLHNILRISSGLNHNYKLSQYLVNNEPNILGMNSSKQFVCCFGTQAYINYHFLKKLEEIYHISNLVHYVKIRADRCAIERIMGLLFTIEYPNLNKIKSMLGNIHVTGNFGYTFQAYEESIKKRNALKPVVKVWTGR